MSSRINHDSTPQSSLPLEILTPNISFLNFIFFYFWLHWVFVSVHGLFFGCGERGLLFVAMHGLLIVVASLVVEHGL